MKKNLKETWEINARAFRFDGSDEEKIQFLLNYAVLAPSTHNIQPWLFEIRNGVLNVFVDSGRTLPEGDKKGTYALISVGAAIENFVLAADSFGIGTDVSYINEKDSVARIKLVHRENNENISLRSAITRRLNYRGPYENKDLPAMLKNQIERDINIYKGVEGVLITERGPISTIAELTREGMKRAHSNRNFAREIGNLIRNNLSEKKDGIPAYTMNAPTPLSFFIASIIKTFNMGKILGALNAKSIRTMPAVVALCGDNALSVGRAAERILVHAAEEGIMHSIFVASLEDSSLRNKLKESTKLDKNPLFLFGLGYPKKDFKHSPRIPVEEKQIKTR